jgi:KaiC/GvpD/RAD55 family RecA-like ATPase
VLTVTTPDLSGNLVTGVRLSTIVDSIVLFRYVEIEGRMDRSLVLLKMRGTKLDSSIKRFLIDSKGITVDGTFEGYTGILTGTAQRMLQHFVRSEARIAEAEGKARARRRKDFGKKIKKKTH